VGADDDLRVVDDVVFLLAHAGDQDQAMAFGDLLEPGDARAAGDRFGELPGVRRAMAVDDQLREEDELRLGRGGAFAPAVDRFQDAFGIAEPAVHAHGGDAGCFHGGLRSRRVGRATRGPPIAARARWASRCSTHPTLYAKKLWTSAARAWILSGNLIFS